MKNQVLLNSAMNYLKHDKQRTESLGFSIGVDFQSKAMVKSSSEITNKSHHSEQLFESTYTEFYY